MDITEATLIIENNDADEAVLQRSITAAQQALADHRAQVKEVREWMLTYGPITDYAHDPSLFWTQLRAVRELEDYSSEYFAMSKMVTRWTQSLNPNVNIDLINMRRGSIGPMVRLGRIDAGEVPDVATALRIATRVTRDAGQDPTFLADVKNAYSARWYVSLDVSGETDQWQVQDDNKAIAASGSLTDVLTYLAKKH